MLVTSSIYAAFIHRELHEYAYLTRTIPRMNTYRKPLDEIIAKDFSPTLMESIVFDDESDLCSLPIRDGDLGIPILRKSALIHYESSKVITAPLVAIIMNQVDVH